MSCRALSSSKGAPRPAVGHMPFPGHRTVAQVDAFAKGAPKAKDYGFDPDALSEKHA